LLNVSPGTTATGWLPGSGEPRTSGDPLPWSDVLPGVAHHAFAGVGTGDAGELTFEGGGGTFEGEFSNVTRSYAGKGVVRYTW
jgi:hypothetical protein